MDIRKLAEESEAYVIERREFYHAHPQLTHQEEETRDFIHKDLEALGITDITDMTNCFGLIATIHGAKPGKTVALRTDIDALPVPEETGASFASIYPGKSHACGHDTHIAMLLGAAKILQENREELCGNVRLVVQPAEEVVQGSKLMIAGGALEGVDAIYGAHTWGMLEKGKMDITFGPRLAYAGLFDIDIEGLAAHGSAPHLGHDAIAAAASIIQNVQQYVSRINNPLSPLVVTIGKIIGGTRFNVIPNSVHMEGTLRAYTKERHEEVLTQIVENTGKALGVNAKLKFEHVVDPLYNKDENLVKIAQDAVKKLYGPETLATLSMDLGSEDFANYGAVVPSVFGFLGAKEEIDGNVYSNHHEKFLPDNSILKIGTAVMTQFAVDFLNQNA